ncbi:hypothetical protein Leryth_013542 [Lithospermum erythrorhizon]|nr:hypothetical protein Leryth_013542 [Lithospermum erythrorhizon]
MQAHIFSSCKLQILQPHLTKVDMTHAHLQQCENDVGRALDVYCGKLSPKEQTVVLKEQRSWDKVLRVFEWMKSHKEYLPNVIHYNVVLRALGRAKKWDELRLCWIDMAKNGVVPTNNTYSMLVDVYGKAGLVKESLLWIKHMKLRGFFPDEVTMNTLVRVFKDAGEYDRGIKFYKDWCIGKIDLDDVFLDSLENADVEVGSEPVSLKHYLLTELFRTGGRSHHPGNMGISNEQTMRIPLRTSTYNTLIDLYGKAGRLKDAADTFAHMLKSGVALDTITFNTMIHICGTHGRLSEAESLLNKMDERGIAPDTKTYNILLSLYANKGNLDAALICYRKIREVGLFPDDVTHRAVLRILCERKKVQEVEVVIGEIEKSRKHIDEHSVPIIVKMYVSEGLLESARLLLEKCQSSDCLSTKIRAAVMDVYAEAGLCAEAEAVFLSKRNLFGQNRELVEYNVMIKAYGKAKLYDKAFSLFKGMKTHGTWPDMCTYNSLIQMFAGCGMTDEARDLLSDMRKAGFNPQCVTYSAVIASYARANRLSEAVDLFQEMLRFQVMPNEVVYGSIINGFAEAGDIEEAFHYFQHMEKSGISANQIVLTSMIKAYSKVGSAEGARHLYEKIKDFKGGPDIVASNSMLNLYGELGMVSEAKLVFDNLIEKGWADGVTFATMMYVYKNMGMLDEAIEVAEQMKQSGLLRDCITFNKVMACYATHGRLLECCELLYEMVNRKLLPDGGTFKVLFTILKKGGLPAEGVRQLESSYEDGKPFARQAVMACVYSVVACGKSSDALKTFMKIQDKGLKPDVVTAIYLVGCYGEAGMVEAIKRIYGQLKYGDIEPNKSVYNAVIDAYRKVNRNNLADLVSHEMRFAFDVPETSDSKGAGEAQQNIPEKESISDGFSD